MNNYINVLPVQIIFKKKDSIIMGSYIVCSAQYSGLCSAALCSPPEALFLQSLLYCLVDN